MAHSRSRLTAEIDFDRDGKQHGFIRLPYSVHRSAYGWIPIPVACIKNGDGPRVLLMAGNHGDEYEGQVALGKLIRSLEAEKVHGRIIILPSANFPAAMAGMRTSPLDEGNLNRSSRPERPNRSGCRNPGRGAQLKPVLLRSTGFRSIPA
jgi:uncharacterized protein